MTAQNNTPKTAVLICNTGSPAAPTKEAVAKYLAENMAEKITLEQAASKFHASPTAIKTAFKSVFGFSFYAYTKARKMESAAYMLEYTSRTVSDIASEHGYDNPGKFAAAFRTVKGVSPTEYRARSAR